MADAERDLAGDVSDMRSRSAAAAAATVEGGCCSSTEARRRSRAAACGDGDGKGDEDEVLVARAAAPTMVAASRRRDGTDLLRPISLLSLSSSFFACYWLLFVLCWLTAAGC